MVTIPVAAAVMLLKPMLHREALSQLDNKNINNCVCL